LRDHFGLDISHARVDAHRRAGAAVAAAGDVGLALLRELPVVRLECIERQSATCCARGWRNSGQSLRRSVGVGTIFALVAVCWVLRPQLVAWTGLKGLDDAVIALAGALVLFLVPSGRQRTSALLDWHTAQYLPWDILLAVRRRPEPCGRHLGERGRRAAHGHVLRVPARCP